MLLAPGTVVGVYEIVGLLGAGGMGQVYRARDQRLQRDVAIKILNDEVQDRTARSVLQAEARTASALNHPHILTIYDIGLFDSDPPRDYIAMEYIEGETLRQAIHRREPEALIDVMLQVGEGLAKAHEAKVVHRDLKPENIMITGDGYAKILDFGLAKLLRGETAADRPTEVMPLSGAIVGTIGYMSPEQVSGQMVDARADIFAFGCILYEVVSRRRAFEANSALETLSRIISGTPPPPLSSPELQRIVTRCLAKDLSARYGNMRAVVADLRRYRERGRDRGARKSWRLSQLTFDKSVEQYPTVSPDGTRVVFSREIGKVRNLFMIVVGEGGEERITGGDHDDIQAAWSSDGTALLFARGREAGSRVESSDVFGRFVGADICRLELATGNVTVIVSDAANPAGSPDGAEVAYDASRGGPQRIWIADSRGRNPRQVTTDETDAAHHVRPRWSPDGRHLVYQALEGTKFDVRVVDLETHRNHAVTDDYTTDIHPVWSPDGEWIYFSSYRSGGINVWRIPVDTEGHLLGNMEQVTSGAGQDVDLDIATADGAPRLVFATLKQNADIWRLPVDPRTGAATGPPEAVIATTRENTRGAWSPDGRSIAFGSDRGGEMNLWLLTIDDGRIRQLTRGEGGDFQPNWSPDGRSLTFFSGRSGSLDIWRLDLESSDPVRLTGGEGININPFSSPDGSRIAFMSDRDGALEVWVMNADGTNVRQLTTVGVIGHFLRWSHDGSHIYFRCPTGGAKPRTMTVPADGGEPQATAEVVGGAHMSLSPDQSLIMDVVAHRTLWVSPLTGGEPQKVFEFDDPESRIDYPVWSPDGHFIIFDRFVPHGGDVFLIE